MSGHLSEQLDRARIEALRLVGSVIEVMGDDAPAALVDAHRVLATGYTDAERPERGTTARDTGNPPVTERRVWPRWAVLAVRIPLMGPLMLVGMVGHRAWFAFDWLDRRLPARVSEYRPNPIVRTG